MKKDLLLTLGMMVALMAGAAEISPEQALQRAMDAAARDVFAKSLTLNRKPGQAHKLSYVMNYTQNPTQAAVYVFSAPGNQGYLVSPADDRFPALLGYSDTGRIDADNIPPQMQWWLSEYAREMDYAIRNGLTTNQPENVQMTGMVPANTMAKAPRKPIAPLLETKYNQGEPYNNQCPVIKYTDGTTWGRAVTGCVATAMAQMMCYWKYPATGQGSHSYICKPNGGQSFTESMDFSTVTFDWDNMLPAYTSGNYTDTQADAVAELMHACGVSVDMTYSPRASGAVTNNVADALKTYFKYDPSVAYISRIMFTNAEWEQLIYNELAQARPVEVGGQSSSSGHAFVCDGYQGDHYFHFNWGWGGMGDGYFLFCALNPGALGIGGGAGGYNYGQDVIFNIFPEGQGTPQVLPATEAAIVCNGNFTYGVCPDYPELGKVFYPANDNDWGAYYNGGGKNFVGTIGVVFEDTASSMQYPMIYYYMTEDNPLFPGYGFPFMWSELPEDMPDGEYKVYPAYLKAGESGSWTMMTAPCGFTNYLNMTISDGAITAVNKPEIDPATLPDLMAPYFSIKGNASQNASVFCNMSFLNVSDTDYSGSLRMMACDSRSNETEIMTIPQSLPAQVCVPSSGDLTLSLAPGDYDIYFKDDYNRKLTGTYHITVTEGTSGDFNPDFQMTGMSPVEFEPSDQPQYFDLYWKRNPTIDSNTSFKFSCKLTDAQGNVKFTTNGGPAKLPTTATYRAGVSNFIPNFGTGTYMMSVKAQSALGGTDVFGKEYDACKPFPVVIRSIVETLSVNESCKVPMGKTKSIKYTVTPASAATELMWTSLNPDVVTVDANGKVTGMSEGTAKVIGCSPNGHYGICEVTVLNASEPDPDPDPSGINTPGNDSLIHAVYTTQGIRVLENVKASDIDALPGGIYIIVTDKGTYKKAINR